MGISKGAVVGKARRLGLPARESPINGAPWTEEEDNILERIYAGEFIQKEICKQMNRSLFAIKARAKFLGLVAGRSASPQSRGVVSRPAARAHRELPKLSETRAASPSRPRAAINSGALSSADERQASSRPERDLPGAVAETPPRRVFSHKQCQYITHSEARAHRFCEAPVVENAKGRPSAFCATHFELCCIKPSKHATNPAPATWLKNCGMVWARG
jgi:hypothetical protein